MHRTAAICVLVVAGLFGLASCASTPADSANEPGISTQGDSTSVTGDNDAEGSDDETAGSTAETTIPEGARAASAEFPFPVPEGWNELEPVTEEKIGKKTAMSASYAHPGDAQTAAATYEQLLKAAGFDAYPYPLGEATNDASLMVEGRVNGVAHKGVLNFDTNFEGTARVSINLTEN